ncbi:MAG: small basic family protein [Armatimonadota bacterium]|nr:small basic family protein [Armatimonadota bacterium]
MVWLPIVGLLIGFIIIYLPNVTVPAGFASYLSLATLAGLDSLFGGIRAGLEEKFRADIFISGFLVNTLLAVLLAYLGDQIGVDLFLAAVVALGGRVFLNLSLIRRYWLTQIALTKKEH